jgi:hypothetical protein
MAGFDLFEKRFLFVPINESLHWSLAIICNAGRMGLTEEARELLPAQDKPCIIFLDSLACHDTSKIYGMLVDYLARKWQTRQVAAAKQNRSAGSGSGSGTSSSSSEGQLVTKSRSTLSALCSDSSETDAEEEADAQAEAEGGAGQSAAAEGAAGAEAADTAGPTPPLLTRVQMMKIFTKTTNLKVHERSLTAAALFTAHPHLRPCHV